MKASFYFLENDDEWFATGWSIQMQGTLSYNKKTQKYFANFFEPKVLFPRLAGGNYCSLEDCPVDRSYRPKSDFLFLMALRQPFSKSSATSQLGALEWRQLAIRTRVAESEIIRGAPLPDKNKAYAMEIAASWSEFETHVGNWLAGVAQKENAAQIFRRFARWLDEIKKIEEEGVPQNYRRFYAAVETAAASVGGVPTKKAVKTAFEAGMSANQLGSGESYRSMEKRLKFSWLPKGGRGPDTSQRKSGI